MCCPPLLLRLIEPEAAHPGQPSLERWIIRVSVVGVFRRANEMWEIGVAGEHLGRAVHIGDFGRCDETFDGVGFVEGGGGVGDAEIT